MSKARKCDRCGRYYEPSADSCYVESREQTRNYPRIDGDLCQECSTELEAWWSGGETGDARDCAGRIRADVDRLLADMRRHRALMAADDGVERHNAALLARVSELEGEVASAKGRVSALERVTRDWADFARGIEICDDETWSLACNLIASSERVIGRQDEREMRC